MQTNTISLRDKKKKLTLYNHATVTFVHAWTFVWGKPNCGKMLMRNERRQGSERGRKKQAALTAAQRFSSAYQSERTERRKGKTKGFLGRTLVNMQRNEEKKEQLVISEDDRTNDSNFPVLEQWIRSFHKQHIHISSEIKVCTSHFVISLPIYVQRCACVFHVDWLLAGWQTCNIHGFGTYVRVCVCMRVRVRA